VIYTHDKHHTTDDALTGGGAGMVMKPEPIFEAVEAIKIELVPTGTADNVPVILLTPQGRLLTQEVAKQLTQYDKMIFICGEYEGVTNGFREHLVTDEISIGDYILSGGELAANWSSLIPMVRLLPGFLGSPES